MTDLRLAYFDNFNTNLRTYSWNATNFVQVGSDLSLASFAGNNMSMTMIGTKKLAFISNFDSLLRCYYNASNAGTWVQLGQTNPLVGGVSTTIGDGSLAMIRPDRFAITGGSYQALSNFDHNGDYFSKVWNSLTTAGIGGNAITGMNIGRIAYIEGTAKNLKMIDFNGTDFVQVGSSLNIASCVNPAITALSHTRIAFIENGTNELRIYDYNETTEIWAQVGSNLSIAGGSNYSIEALSADTIALIDNGNKKLRAYYFNGTIFALIGSELSIAGALLPQIASFFKPMPLSCYNEIPLTGQGFYPESP